MYNAGGAKFALVGQIGGIPIIHDLNGAKSVTNAAEQVVATVLALCGANRPQAIIYRDSAGMFDALRVRHGEFAGFMIVNGHTDAEAFNCIAYSLQPASERPAWQ
ncbi:hypothetical protein AB3X94_37130 [Paraburkholderia sp. BR10923]|uniref:hypothetical protein n=1 Tax=Paraburkholderia sp. BR10923 TaxID=3236992 RepID=UPI0034CEA5E7